MTDFLLPPDGLSASKPVLVLLAGLSGGSDEGYIRDVIQNAVRLAASSVLLNQLEILLLIRSIHGPTNQSINQ